MITGTGDSVISNIDGPGLGDITKPMGADVMYTCEPTRNPAPGRPRDPHYPAVHGPASVHCESALLADVVIASDTTVFFDMPDLAAGLAPGEGLFVVWRRSLA